MSVVVMQVFVSLLLVAGSLVLFIFSVRQRDFEHADRLALAPLDDDDYPPPAVPTPTPTPTPNANNQQEIPCTQNESNTTTP